MKVRGRYKNGTVDLPPNEGEGATHHGAISHEIAIKNGGLK